MPDAPGIRIEKHTITTRDDTSLTATLYRPKQHNNHTVLIAGAMGMPQRFYRHYATFLAESGCVVLTFDYRGIAESRSKDSLWGYEARLWQWASHDLQAMIKWLTRQYPGSELSLVGHSLGALLPGASSHFKHVTSLIGVSSANIYQGNWQSYNRLSILLFCYVILPLLSRAIGYFPSAWFGFGEPLPRDIALDWACAMRHPQGIKGLFIGTEHHHYRDFTGYTRFYSFSDDSIAPEKPIDAILSYYPGAKYQERRHISPENIGIDKIGHIGFFRPQMQDTLWQESLQWLLNPALASQILVHDAVVPSTPVVQPG